MQHCRDFMDTELLIIKKECSNSLFWRKAAYCLQNQSMQFLFLYHFLWIDPCVGTGKCIAACATNQGFERAGIALLPPQIAAAYIQNDAIEPAFEARIFPQLMQRKICRK